jgi:NADH dehydrogenase/NADH:ubiquinone oxidoreductase subunit G
VNREVRSTLEQLKAKLYPQTQPTEKQMEHKQTSTPPAVPSIPTADLFKPMSVSKAAKHCLSLNIDKPSAIHKLTGKPIDQIYTALWGIRNNKKKAKVVVKKEERATSTESTNKKDQRYITFLENRMSEWQAEARKQAHEINHLKAALAKSHETRNVTSEVTEVMEEVMKLRATVAYLESKLFGGK